MVNLEVILFPQEVYGKGTLYLLIFFFFFFFFFKKKICAEGLSTLSKKSVQEGKMEGVAFCCGAPILSHLFFCR